MVYATVVSESGIHIPVLTAPLLEVLCPGKNELGLDCTLGLGGHARAVMEREETVRIIGLDQDPRALEQARDNLVSFSGRMTFVHTNFADLLTVLEELNLTGVDFVYADLGVNSTQLEAGDRGFSFQQDGPLDMRMNPETGKRAADLVNSLRETELGDLIFKYGDEGRSKKIARMICQARRSHRIDSTAELAGIVCLAMGVDPKNLGQQRIHPATKTFQALRIAVNNELGNLEKLLEIVPRILKPGGRFAVISFHSLEDRLVKDDFKTRSQAGIYEILTPKPIEATASEILRNSRSRSAKLRAAQKVS
jgi:16S rRNA (cytosine1402-N4)-methyltransferase